MTPRTKIPTNLRRKAEKWERLAHEFRRDGRVLRSAGELREAYEIERVAEQIGKLAASVRL